jgi:hypothetical protein
MSQSRAGWARAVEGLRAVVREGGCGCGWLCSCSWTVVVVIIVGVGVVSAGCLAD